MKTKLKQKLILAAVIAAYSMSQTVFAEDKSETVNLEKVKIISTTPLSSIGLPINQIPSNVQTLNAKDLEKSQSLDITDYMTRYFSGININNIQNNPLQMDVNYRGFIASPLLGSPQGLSVYVDGVRMNQAFGDVVSWDLIPKNAILGMQLMPGSNPLFGLNTLGGALSIQTKDGRNSPGGALQLTYGSFDRKIAEFEYGGSQDSLDWFVAGTYFDENGWRDKSPTDFGQLFGKVGWQGENTNLKLTYSYANTDLTGNGLVPKSLNRRDYDAVFTSPDNTKNKSNFVNLQLDHFFTDAVNLSGNVYYKKLKTNTLNGDMNDESLPEVPGGAGQSMGTNYGGASAANNCLAQVLAADEPGEKCPGVINRTSTVTDTFGLFSQVSVVNKLFDLNNSFVVGAGAEYSSIKFNQSAEFADIFGRAAVGTGYMADGTNGDIDGDPDDRRTKLNSKNVVYSIYGTDTLALNDKLSLTGSARYNHVRVANRDQLITDRSDPGTLTGTHHFNRINPAVGLTYAHTETLNFYGGYNEGSRAPTSVELGCANEDAPCRLPNSFAGDPPLKQVVTKSWDAGVRGRFNDDIKWSAGVFTATNYDDLQFVSAGSTGAGFFKNFGETRRRGIEAALSGDYNALSYGASYTFLDATYQSGETINGNNNNSGQPVSAIEGNGANLTPVSRVVSIKKGDKIPLLPRNQLKLFGSYKFTPAFELGADAQIYSDAFVRGNENNDHKAGTVTYNCVGAVNADTGAVNAAPCGNRTKQGEFKGGGKIGGYTLVNLVASYKIQPEWKLFGRVNNLFDREYATAGQLGADPFNSGGNVALGTGTQANRSTTIGDTFVAPGAPRSAWVGVRYEFGAKK
ncbi:MULTISPECIES: TonB-dependent receptor [Methylotenera]|uniref:TonB-dependent receptor n=1 Tax=Methylotenera TaxID=359407 RepID=UPI00037B3ECF|nr:MULTISPECIES: TonB-dependent receptor [Methylotenera]